MCADGGRRELRLQSHVMARLEPREKFEDPVDTWNAFMRHPHVRGAQEEGAPWVVFRGQADAKHGLSPSLLRAVSDNRDGDPTPETLLEYEDACREEFEAQAHLYPFA